MVAATTNGLFTSTNNGDSWEMATEIAAGDTIVKLIFDYPLSTEDTGGASSAEGCTSNVFGWAYCVTLSTAFSQLTGHCCLDDAWLLNSYGHWCCDMA